VGAAHVAETCLRFDQHRLKLPIVNLDAHADSDLFDLPLPTLQRVLENCRAADVISASQRDRSPKQITKDTYALDAPVALA
jgi:hypothetical protein